ncbi:DUF1684 domain-containing protein [Aquimarina sp. TRL1]|nr:DUF1684 domain-containing protein [Aquimarina sp. TRL1]
MFAKKIEVYRIFYGLIILFFNGIAQQSTVVEDVLKFQSALNEKFASEEMSPLPSEDFENFKNLDFFKIDPSFSVQATFVRTPYETPFVMKTTTNREPIYVKYGEVHFQLEDKEYILNVYQNQMLVTQEAYKDYLFLPYTDMTNGKTTYEGGRFIDLKIPEGNELILDFNKSYNPYCCYNDRYSCPVPPVENHLEIEIPVGVKKYLRSEEH